MIAVGNDRQFADLAGILSVPQWAADTRFATNAARVQNRSVLIPLIQARLKKDTKASWLERLEVARVPCGPVNTIPEVFADPQIRHRGMRIDLAHPLAGSTPGVKSPVNFSDTPAEYDIPPPLLGEHTEDILRSWLGLAAEEVARLRQQQVI